MNDPIAVWGKANTIVEGHGRFEALRQIGIKEAPCIRLDHLTDENGDAKLNTAEEKLLEKVRRIWFNRK